MSHKPANRRMPVFSLALFSMLAPALLGSCGGGSDSSTVANNDTVQVELTAVDETVGLNYVSKTYTYTTTKAFRPLNSALPGYIPSDVEKEALNSINQKRALGGSCAGVTKSSAQAIVFEGHLHKAAQDYANLLQQKDFQLDNDASSHMADGTLPMKRMIDSGYKPGKETYFAESLDFGDSDISGVIDSWVKSPSHCDTLFDNKFNVGSIARSDKPNENGQYYWVMDIASF